MTLRKTLPREICQKCLDSCNRKEWAACFVQYCGPCSVLPWELPIQIFKGVSDFFLNAWRKWRLAFVWDRSDVQLTETWKKSELYEVVFFLLRTKKSNISRLRKIWCPTDYGQDTRSFLLSALPSLSSFFEFDCCECPRFQQQERAGQKRWMPHARIIFPSDRFIGCSTECWPLRLWVEMELSESSETNV